MPVSGCNGKYQDACNGGFGGSIEYSNLATSVRNGYAAASTDTGHSGAPTAGSWALGHPEKITDFGYRAIHEMTVRARALILAFYGTGPQHSYFAGCSNGGRQVLMVAQCYSEDYDGIIVCGPARNFTHLLTYSVR